MGKNEKKVSEVNNIKKRLYESRVGIRVSDLAF